MKNSSHVYVTPTIYIDLCPQGEQLLQRLDDLLALGVQGEAVDRALQAYFTHRNGVIGNGRYKKLPCPKCSKFWTEK